jgi:y4mF family transcriptional regulator
MNSHVYSRSGMEVSMDEGRRTIRTTKDLGISAREAREKAGLTQAKVAALCRVGTRFISDLENGKPTVQVAKALHVLGSLGMAVVVKPREFGRD